MVIVAVIVTYVGVLILVRDGGRGDVLVGERVLVRVDVKGRVAVMVRVEVAEILGSAVRVLVLDGKRVGKPIMMTVGGIMINRVLVRTAVPDRVARI